MNDPSTRFELVEFEQVEAAPDTVLLRIAARPSAAAQDGRWTLVVSVGANVYRHEQLPALPGPPGMIRAAFSAPAHQFGAGAQFALQFADGSSVRLPSPVRRRAPGAHGAGVGIAGGLGGPRTAPFARAGGYLGGHDPDAGTGPEFAGSRLAEAERRAESRRLALVEVERRLQVERDRRAAAEADLARLRAERDSAREQREEAVAERDEAIADRDRAEARARAAAASAGSFEAQVRAATEEAARATARLESELADRTAELERVRDAAELAQARAHASRRELTALDEQLAHAQAQISVLEEALAARVSEVDGLTAETSEALAAAKAESAAAQERAEQLETLLASMREAAQRASAQHAIDLETAQSRVDVAHAELEVVRAEHNTMRSRASRIEARFEELEQALAEREAEIDVLRGAVVDAQAALVSDVSTRAHALAEQELSARVADARSEASTALSAEIEVLRMQLGDLAAQAQAANSAARDAERRADAAELALAERSRELDEFTASAREQADAAKHAREELVAAAERTRAELTAAAEKAQSELAAERERSVATTVELGRVRDAAALVAAELMNASEAVEQARHDAAAHQQRAADLQQELSAAQLALNEARAAIAAREAEIKRLTDALETEARGRARAEEELLGSAAQRVLERDFLEVETQAREEALLGRLAQVKANADAAIEAAREQH